MLTVTSSTSIDSYFATKLAELRTKAEKNDSTSETVSAAADDTASTNKCKQTDQLLTPSTSSGTGPPADCNKPTVKQRKKKRKKVDNIDDDCHTNDTHRHFRSLKSNVTSKKKKHVDDLLEITVEPPQPNNSSQNVKTCRRKKERRSTTATSVLNDSEHSVKSKSRKKKKLTHDAR